MDVNTIFYFFSGTKDEYIAEWNSGKINPRTIVFIAATGEIYKNNVRYGGLTQSEVRNETTTIVNENAFDPSSILASISTLQGLIDGLDSRIDDIMTEKQNELTDIVNNILSEYAMLKKTAREFFNDDVFITELNTYLLTVGYVTTNSAVWTTLQQTINSIISRVTSVEETQGRINESQILQWIRDGVSGIDLSTYALKGDLEGLITLDDLKASGVLDNLITNFSTAFVNLKSKAEGSEAVIGAWSREHANDTITDLFGALSVQVDNLESSVTTSLSSTVSQYLQDSALPDTINSYLRTQAGLVLEANLAGSVAALFSQSQQVQNGVTGYLNTAGYLTESNADGALATIIAKQTVAPENEKVYYCDSIDTSDTAATFTAASGQTVAVGYYYSATDLATVCDSTAATIISAASPFLILGTDSKKYKFVKVSSVEGALSQSNIYASIQVGAANNQSFIDMIADKITINADRIDLNGDTWANKLHVNELLVDSLKDADGNSVQVSYLVDKMQENSTYTVEVLDLISGNDFRTLGINYSCSTEFALGERNVPTIVVGGRSTTIRISSRANYSLVGNIKVTMGTKDITNRYTRYFGDFDGGEINVVLIDIPCVTGNIAVKVTGYSYVNNIYFGLPNVVNINGKSSNITLTGDVKTSNVCSYTNNSVQYYPLNKPVSWALDTAYAGVSIANGTSTSNGSLPASYEAPEITIDPTQVSTGTFTVKATLLSGSYATFPITIIDDSAVDFEQYYVDFHIGYGNSSSNSCPTIDNSGCLVIYATTDARFNVSTTYAPTFWEKTNSSVATISYVIDTTLYTGDAASIYGNGAIAQLFANKPTCVPVKMTVTLAGIYNGTDQTFDITRWICVKNPVFGLYNSSEDYYTDIFGNSDKALQFVSAAGSTVGKPMLTKYISWDRNNTSEVAMIYLCEGEPGQDGVPALTVDSSAANNCVATSALYTYTDSNSVKKTYLTFTGSAYGAAYTIYNNLDHRITIDDQQNPRSGKVVVSSADGSNMTVYINQSGNFGFYNILKDQVHDCVSAYYLAPKYYWDRLEWYAETSDTVVRTDLYPDAILVPASGKWMCVAWRGVTANTTMIGNDATLNHLKMQYRIDQ